jgi:hypothetical protein
MDTGNSRPKGMEGAILPAHAYNISCQACLLLASCLPLVRLAPQTPCLPRDVQTSHNTQKARSNQGPAGVKDQPPTRASHALHACGVLPWSPWCMSRVHVRNTNCFALQQRSTNMHAVLRQQQPHTGEDWPLYQICKAWQRRQRTRLFNPHTCIRPW